MGTKIKPRPLSVYYNMADCDAVSVEMAQLLQQLLKFYGNLGERYGECLQWLEERSRL